MSRAYQLWNPHIPTQCHRASNSLLCCAHTRIRLLGAMPIPSQSCSPYGTLRRDPVVRWLLSCGAAGGVCVAAETAKMGSKSGALRHVFA